MPTNPQRRSPDRRRVQQQGHPNNEDLLFNPDGPAISVLAASHPRWRTVSWLGRLRTPKWDILRVRGTKSFDEARFFDELAAALQFPYYFGENWNAVWDCITDLNWLKGSSFLIVFDSADHLLSQSDRGFQFLLRVLADAHERWHQETADFGAWGRRPLAFQSALARDPDSVEKLMQRMRAANAVFDLV